MPEWFYEQGIGENRAILVDEDNILEAAIELPGDLRAGSVQDGRLTTILIPGRRGIVTLEGGGEALIEPLPARLTEGQGLRVEIVREAIAEAGRDKLAKCRQSDAAPKDGPALRDRLGESGHAVTLVPAHGADRFEQAGWSELLEQAAGGEIAFAGGALRMSVTPAMTLFDVDGALALAALAVAGAEAAARAIRRLGITGSIGVDLPTLGGRAERQAAAEAVDRVLPQPFERTAVNGFGFLQIVRRKQRPSIPELLQADPVGAAARALLRRTERAGGSGQRALVAALPIIARIEAHPEWIEELARRIGAPLALRVDPALAISAGHAHSQFA